MLFSVASVGTMVATRVSDSPLYSVSSDLLSVMDSIGTVTETSQVAFILSTWAVMVALPLAMAETLPSESIVATFVSELVHETFLCVASAGLTVATSVSDSPLTNEREVLSRVMDVTPTNSLLTVTMHADVLPPARALIVVRPSAIAVTNPWLLTVATDGLVDDHVMF